MARDEVSRNLSQINDEIAKINKSLRDATRETNSLAKSLRLDPKNVELASTYSDRLANRIDLAKQKVELLKQKQAEMARQDATSKTTEQYRKLTVQITQAESEVRVLNKKLAETNNTRLSNLQSGLNSIARAAKAILASVVAIGTAFAVMGDEIEKNSEKFSVSAETYQRWSYIFDETLLKTGGYVTALNQMSMLMSQVQRGQGQMLKGLEALGIEIESLKGKNPQELLEYILSILGSIADEDERLEAAAAIFGSYGAEIALIAGLTQQEVQRLNDEITKTGIMSEEQVVKAKKLNDAITELKQTFKTVIIDFAEKLMPTFMAMINVLKALIPIINIVAEILAAIGPVGQGILLTLLAVVAVLPKVAAMIKAVNIITAAFSMTLSALLVKLIAIAGILIALGLLLNAIFGQTYTLDVNTNADQLLGETNRTIYEGTGATETNTTTNNVTYNDYSTTNITTETEVDLDEVIEGLNSKVIQVGGK